MDAKILILESQIQQYMKKITHHHLVEFILQCKFGTIFANQ